MSNPTRPQPQPHSIIQRTAVVQPPSRQARPTPAAPPVYRPQPVPKVLQRKAAVPPPVAPQPVPRVLQPKKQAAPARPQTRGGVVQRIGETPAQNLDSANYHTPDRNDVRTEQDRWGTLYKIHLRHRTDRDRDLEVHVHHQPRGPRGINVRYYTNDNNSQPAPASIDNFIGTNLGI